MKRVIRTSISEATFCQIVGQLALQSVSFAWRDAGTIFLEFGGLIERKNHPQGEFEFMIDFPYWFRKEGRSACSWEDASSTRDYFLQSLVGNFVKEIHDERSSTVISFKHQQLQLEIANEDGEDHNWSLYVRHDRYGIGSSDFWVWRDGGGLMIERSVNPR